MIYYQDFLIILFGLIISFVVFKKYKFSKKLLVISLIIYLVGMLLDSISTWYIFENWGTALRRERNIFIHQLYEEHGSLSAFQIYLLPQYWLISFLIFLGTFLPLFIASKFDKKMLPISFYALGMMRFLIAILNFLIFLKI